VSHCGVCAHRVASPLNRTFLNREQFYATVWTAHGARCDAVPGAAKGWNNFLQNSRTTFCKLTAESSTRDVCLSKKAEFFKIQSTEYVTLK